MILLGALALLGSKALAEPSDDGPEPELLGPSSQAVTQIEARRAAPHTLGGHVFVLPLRVDSPFVLNQFTFRQGGGLVSVPRVRAEGYDESFDLLLAGVVETARFDAAIRPWVGIYGVLGGELSTGLNPDSAFFVGARGGLSWETGAVFRLVHDEGRNFQLAFRAIAGGRHGLAIEPSGLVTALVEDREATVQTVLDGGLAGLLLARQRSLVGGGSLAAAYAISDRFGLIGSVRSTAGTRHRTWLDGDTVRDLDTPLATLATGAALDVDLRPVPLDLQLEYRFRIEGEGGAEETLDTGLLSRHFAGLGIYYGGRQDVQLGLNLATLLLSAGDLKERWAQVEMVLRISL